jgi:hypothetical protein
MKRSIRVGVFETNSSSTHSITMCSKEEYDKWENGEMLINDGSSTKPFLTREEAIEKLKQDTTPGRINFEDKEEVDEELRDWGYKTYEQYWDDCDMETFEDNYTTKSGEEVIAFGYYGSDC